MEPLLGKISVDSKFSMVGQSNDILFLDDSFETISVVNILDKGMFEKNEDEYMTNHIKSLMKPYSIDLSEETNIEMKNELSLVNENGL